MILPVILFTDALGCGAAVTPHRLRPQVANERPATLKGVRFLETMQADNLK